MNHLTLAVSAVLVVLLVLALAREVRLRRALQALLKRLLSFWRNRDAEEPVARGDADDDPAADGRVVDLAELIQASPTRDDDLNFALARSTGHQAAACEFRHDGNISHRKVLAGRKPMLLFRLSGWLLLRSAERTFDD